MFMIDKPMPTGCDCCPCMDDYIYCTAANKNIALRKDYSKRPSWCPLIDMEKVEPEVSCEMKYWTNCECSNCHIQIFREDLFCRGCGRPIEWK